jgi:hypothetical protein
VDDGFQQFAVHDIKALGVDVEHRQGFVGRRSVDMAVAFDLRVIAHPTQQTIGNARRAPGSPCNLHGPARVHGHFQQPSRTSHDLGELLRRIKLQPGHDPKPVSQRVGEHARTGGGSHQREGL